MFKKLVSVLVATALSLSFLVGLTACSEEEQAAVQSGIEQLSEETAREGEGEEKGNNGGEVEAQEKKPMSIFEYFESVKDENIFVVLGAEDQVDNVKQLVVALAQSRMITVEFVLNFAISKLGIEEVYNLRALCDYAEEQYPYEELSVRLSDAKAGYIEAEEFLNGFASYAELINAVLDREDVQNGIQAAAQALVGALDENVPQEAYELMEEKGFKFSNAQETVDFVVGLINDADIRNLIGEKMEEVYAYETLLAEIAKGEQVFDAMIEFLGEYDSYYEAISAVVPLDKVLFTEEMGDSIVGIIEMFENTSVETLYEMAKFVLENSFAQAEEVEVID